jgi:cell division protein FtsQ
MKFNKLRKYRRIFFILGAIAFVVIFAILQSNYKNTLCTNIKVTVLDSAESKFVSKSTIISFIYKNIQDDIVGDKFKNVDLALIEEELTNDFFIKSAEVFRSENGTLEIEITQRKPIARIYTDLGETYYIDADGYFLPTSTIFASYVPVFNGNIPHIDSLFAKSIKNINNEMFDSLIFKDIYELSVNLKNDEFTKAMIDQVYVTEENEFEMIPKVGDFKIIFGTIENTEIKFRNLKAFYTEAAPKVGWNKYSAINLTFINQVVCTKK